MRLICHLFFLVISVFPFLFSPVFSQGKENQKPDFGLPGKLLIKPGRIGRVEFKNAPKDERVHWINCFEGLDLFQDSGTKVAFLQSPAPGNYWIAAYTTMEGKATEPSYCYVTCEGEKPVVPPVPPGPGPNKKGNPMEARVKIKFGSAGCTATVIGPRNADGSWNVLTANHCISNGPKNGTGKTAGGVALSLEMINRDSKADLSWLRTKEKELDLPHTFLRPTIPPVGTKVWHAGYGVDRPGNREDGTVSRAPGPDGKLAFILNVSSGDSGGGIFDEDGLVCASVCCTQATQQKVTMYGGNCSVAAKMLSSQSFSDNQPLTPSGCCLPGTCINPIGIWEEMEMADVAMELTWFGSLAGWGRRPPRK